MDNRLKNEQVLIGKTYFVKHSRKGEFVLRITAINEPWITGVVVAGKANAILPYNVVEEGGSVTILRAHSQFKEVKP